MAKTESKSSQQFDKLTKKSAETAEDPAILDHPGLFQKLSGSLPLSLEKLKTLIGDARVSLFTILSLMIFFAVSLYLFRVFVQPGYAGGFETLSHFFKVMETKDIITGNGSYVDWSDKWYAGYHQFLFYPPMFYFLAAFIDYFINDLANTSKIMIIYGVNIAAVSTFLLVFEVLPSRLEVWKKAFISLFASFAYALNPIVLSIYLVRGKPPDFYANALLPLSLYFLLRWLKSDRLKMPVGFTLVTALIMVFHVDTAATLIVISFIFSIIYLKVDLKKRARLFDAAFHRPIFLLTASYIVFLGLTAFFWIPYIFQIKSIGALGSIYSNRIPLPADVFFMRDFNASSTTRYFGLILLMLSFGVIAFKDLKDKYIPWMVTFFVGASLSLFVYTPFADRLPAVNTLFYYAGMIVATISLTVMASLTLYALVSIDWRAILAKALERKTVPKVISTLIVVAILLFSTTMLVADYSFVFADDIITPGKETRHITLQEAINFLKSTGSDGGRLLVIGKNIPQYADLPALTGKSMINGYEVQSSRTSSELEAFMNDKVTKEEKMSAVLMKIDRWNVEYVMVTDRYSKIASGFMEADGMTLAMENSKYKIFHYEPAGFVQSIDPVLVIGSGKDYPIEILKDLNRIGFIVGGSTLLDDYPYEELKKYRSIILYGFDSLDPKKTDLALTKYVGNGGKLLVATDGSLSTLMPRDRFLGLNVREREFAALSRDSEEVFPESASTILGSDENWLGNYFRGPLVPRITVDDKYPIIGRKRIGKGETVFIGYNMLYHAVYEDDPSEYEFLRHVAGNMIGTAKVVETEYEVIKEEQNSRSYMISTDRTSWKLLSMSWSPYWKASVDGKDVETKSYGGLMAVHLDAGSSQVDLTYKQTNTHMFAIMLSLITLMLILIRPLIRRVVKLYDLFPSLVIGETETT